MIKMRGNINYSRSEFGKGEGGAFLGVKMVYLDFQKNHKSYGNKSNGKVVGNKKIYNFCIWAIPL